MFSDPTTSCCTNQFILRGHFTLSVVKLWYGPTILTTQLYTTMVSYWYLSEDRQWEWYEIWVGYGRQRQKEQPKHGGWIWTQRFFPNCDIFFTVTPPLKTSCCHRNYPYFFWQEKHSFYRTIISWGAGLLVFQASIILCIYIYTNLLRKYFIVLPSWPRKNVSCLDILARYQKYVH